jgi:hypothetical protein
MKARSRSPSLAFQTHAFVTTIVNKCDFVPFLSPQNAAALLRMLSPVTLLKSLVTGSSSAAMAYFRPPPHITPGMLALSRARARLRMRV